MSIPPAEPSSSSTGIPPDWLTNSIMTSKTTVASAELLPFKDALGSVIPILEAVQKMTKNGEDFRELCTSIVKIITLLHKEISHNGADAISGLTQFREQLKSLLLEIEQGLGKFQEGSHISKSFRFTSMRDELDGYKARLYELRSNLMVGRIGI
ncbi:hypothetical protein C8J57DRAFT_1385194 [Mycena rebaudengoi]|nr:hypothetical protein C8J57DRAFT_1385194 [Mycena rebaudengoi]